MNIKRQTLRFGLFALLLSGSALAAESQDGIVRETSTDSVFKGTLYQVWSRLRALSPKGNIDEAARSKVVVTAGIRGAEATDTALKPYWKDDRSNDQQYQQQRNRVGQPTRTSVSSGSESANSYMPHGLSSAVRPRRIASSSTSSV